MAVIIRLQNLPWSANAMDVRQFFKNLSIPDGGVHIIGGEMGDAFIAFSTDEDARQAIMRDHHPINGVQVRLLLSSLAEMQKVIETARQKSIHQMNRNTVALPVTEPPPPSILPISPTMTADKLTHVRVPSPPIIRPNQLENLFANNVIPKQNMLTSNATATATVQRLNIQTDCNRNDERSRRSSRSDCRLSSRSLSRERSRSRRRKQRSPSRSKKDDWNKNRCHSAGRRSTERSRDRSRDFSTERKRDRSRDCSPDRKWQMFGNRSDYDNYNSRVQESRSHSSEAENKSKARHISPWVVPLPNTYPTNYAMQPSQLNAQNANDVMQRMAVNPVPQPAAAFMPSAFSISGSAVGLTPAGSNTNAHSLTQLWTNSFCKDSIRSNTLQNPSTALSYSNNSSENQQTLGNCNNGNNRSTMVAPLLNDGHESVGFANTNPYEKIYPNLFAQAAAFSATSQANVAGGVANSTISTKDNTTARDRDRDNPKDSTCIKISNMWAGTTYSDLRKFLSGLYVPHNGIKLINDQHGSRIGVAYIQFSLLSSVSKALCRNNSMLKNRKVKIEIISEEEFDKASDSYRPLQRDKLQQSADGRSNGEKRDAIASKFHKSNNNNAKYNVLYIEDIPTLATEQDIMKMFSCYTLYDILLISNPGNRREFVAYVRFSLEEDAKAAFEEKSRHQIGYRHVRVRPSTIDDMERAKERQRLANEQFKNGEALSAGKLDAEDDKVDKVDLTRDDDDTDSSAIVILDKSDDLSDNANSSSDKSDLNSDNTDGYAKQKDQHKRHDNRDETANKNNFLKPFQETTTTAATDARNNKESFSRHYSTSDPRLKRKQNDLPDRSKNNYNNFNTNYDIQQNAQQFYGGELGNSIENNFIILKNCDYNARISDVAELFLSANLALKHVELLRNDRQLPTGEFIIEFRKTMDAQTAVKKFHNIKFRNRNLRVYSISPQEIADRLGKPFLNYLPGGNGYGGTDSPNSAAGANNRNNYAGIMGYNNSGPANQCISDARHNNNNNNNHYNNNNDNINNSAGGFNMSLNVNPPYIAPLLNQDIDDGKNNNKNNNTPSINDNVPLRFLRKGFVLILENIPRKTQISDIINFFSEFNVKHDDVIRRFNDDGTPSGDARIAFPTVDAARAAFASKRRHLMQKRKQFIETSATIASADIVHAHPHPHD